MAKEKLGAALAGIDVRHIYAVTFGLGTACLAIAACLLMPTYYVNPRVGNAFVLVAFTIVVLGGMGSILGALIGGLFIGVVESLCGLYLGESPRADRHFPHLHPGAAAPPDRPVRSQGMSANGLRADRCRGRRAGDRAAASRPPTSCSISWSSR